MTTKTITKQITECDHCGRDNYHNEVSFETNCGWCEENNIHICDACREEEEFEVWSHEEIIKEEGMYEEDDFPGSWGLIKHDQALDRYVFVKWLK